MHVCCAVIYNEVDGTDCDFNDILEHHVGYGFDYFTSVDEDEKTVKRFKGLILKEGVENEYVYDIDGIKFAYKAKVDDVDWKKTFELCDICSFANSSMFIDDWLFYDNKKSKYNTKAFYKLMKRVIDRNEMIQIVDIHV